MRTVFVSGAGFAFAFTLAGCGQAPTSSHTAVPMKAETICVDIPDVDLFTVVDGKFRPANATTTTLPVLEVPSLVRRLGFDWMSAQRAENIVMVRGQAPDADAKARGFAAARTAIEAHPDFQSGAITRIDDRTIAVNAQAADFQGRMTKTFDELGLSWMTLNIQGQVAVLSGLAPRRELKEAAYRAGRLAIEQDSEAVELITVIVDGITVEDGPPALGQALVGLSTSPTRTDCQDAFDQAMDGRTLEFELNQAVINSSSAKLLNAVTGIALLCAEYRIEVGGHTDARGSDNYNLALSQERADSVRLYLIDKGVSPLGLTAVGYGETQPLDPAMTNQAYEKNRRTEFKLVR